MPEIRVCNLKFPENFCADFSTGVCYEIDSRIEGDCCSKVGMSETSYCNKSLKNSEIPGGALMAGQMRMSLNTIYVTDNPTIRMDIDNSAILCYATHSYIRLVLCLI